MASDNLSRELCEIVAQWRYETLPEAVGTTTKALAGRAIVDAFAFI